MRPAGFFISLKTVNTMGLKFDVNLLKPKGFISLAKGILQWLDPQI